jgi:hypothetical protein
MTLQALFTYKPTCREIKTTIIGMLGGVFCVLHFAFDGSNYFRRVLPSWTRITFGTLNFIASKNGNPRLITSTAPRAPVKTSAIQGPLQNRALGGTAMRE